ncbi:MAG: alpha-L-fucosidase [Tannerella sp.]|jgi:alpha-L-fucosidase|nr:alpha-L-fucosidase [Tannerella sp.]
MNTNKLLLLLLVFVAGFTACNKKSSINIDSVASPKGTEIFQPDWDNLAENYRFPEWFCDAKFGIFIHWGVFSVPALTNEWYSRYMYMQETPEYKHHVATYGDQTEFGYKDFIPMLTFSNYDSDQWAQIFKASGAKYVVPVAEHCDGFAMYDSELNEWNAVKMGPKKDVLGMLKASVEKEGLVFGLSSHRAENCWWYNHGTEFPSDAQDTTITLYGRRLNSHGAVVEGYFNCGHGEDYNESFAREWYARNQELVNKYQPKLFYFDWTVNHPVLMPYLNKFMAYYYNNALDWNEQVAVNTKHGYPTNIQVLDMERSMSDKILEFPWQTCTSIGKKSWGYIDGEENKTPKQIVHDLIDIVSKNGNLLLNIGPRANGTITEEQTGILLSIGQWLKINGEGIYGTRPWKKFGEGEQSEAVGTLTDHNATAYTAQDIRFTTKGNDLYAIVLNWDNAGVLIKSLDTNTIGDAKILNIQLLGSDEKIEWQQTDQGLKLSFPKTKPCDYAYTFKISFDKKVG